MKHLSQYDLLDPEVRPAGPRFVYKGDLEAEAAKELEHLAASGDAFVIGKDGIVVEAPVAEDAVEAHSGPKPWAKPAAVILTALFVVMTAWNLTRLLQGPPPPAQLTPFQVKQALYLGVMRIDAHLRVNGVTPESLDEVGLPEGGPYTYQRVDPAHYVLAFAGNGPKLEYDSSDSKESFFGSPKELLTMGEKK